MSLDKAEIWRTFNSIDGSTLAFQILTNWQEVYKIPLVTQVYKKKIINTYLFMSKHDDLNGINEWN